MIDLHVLYKVRLCQVKFPRGFWDEEW